METDDKKMPDGKEGGLNETKIEMQEAMVAEGVAHPVGPTEDSMMAEEPTKKKSGKGLLLAVVLFALIAAGGIGFGVWEMMDKNSQVDSLNNQISSLNKQNSELTEQLGNKEPVNDIPVNDDNSIDNYLAQSLINPYIGSISFLNNVFDREFDDDVKVEIAYNNTSPTNVLESDRISYFSLNNTYKKLFGDTLEKRNYHASHSYLSFNLTENGNWFEVELTGGGGAGLGMISVVKDAYYEDGNIYVDVYHEVTGFCGIEGADEYCLSDGDFVGESMTGNSIEEANVKEFIGKFSDRIPVYKMTFVKNDGHFVLKKIEKQ